MSIEFLPATGVGRFNAKLNGNSLQIKHRLSIVNSTNLPASATELAQFQTNFQALIKAHWEAKFMFQRGTTTVKPTFVLKFLTVAEQAAAHFVINFSQGQGGSESVGRDAYYKHAALGAAAPRTVQLYTGSTQQPNSAALIAADLPKVLPYYVDFIAGNMSTQTTAQVETLMKQIAKLTPQPKLYVTGYGAQAATYQRTVAALLTQCGLTKVESRNSNKIFIPTTWGKSSQSKMSGRTDYAKISTKDDMDTQTFLTQTAVHSYPTTVVHEYGHMLGLQDEYTCLSKLASTQMVQLNLIDASEQQKFEEFHCSQAVPSANVSAGQAEFIKACVRAGVEVPNFGRQTSSIMSSGAEFAPAHFVWLREALMQISGNNDWAIVPHA